MILGLYYKPKDSEKGMGDAGTMKFKASVRAPDYMFD